MNKKWYLIDAEGKTLGRVAVEAARILRGKNKSEYVPHQDMGDYVIIINAAKANVTGNKRHDRSQADISDGARNQGHASKRQAGKDSLHTSQGICWCRASTYGTDT